MIGHAQSSGCFRMFNVAVLNLASIAEVGTTVAVVVALPEAFPQVLHRRPRPAKRPHRPPRRYTLGSPPRRAQGEGQGPFPMAARAPTLSSDTSERFNRRVRRRSRPPSRAIDRMLRRRMVGFTNRRAPG